MRPEEVAIRSPLFPHEGSRKGSLQYHQFLKVQYISHCQYSSLRTLPRDVVRGFFTANVRINLGESSPFLSNMRRTRLYIGLSDPISRVVFDAWEGFMSINSDPSGSSRRGLGNDNKKSRKTVPFTGKNTRRCGKRDE